MKAESHARLTDIERIGDDAKLMEDLIQLDRIIGECKNEPGSLIMALQN
ncbi:MAG: hypothetical protein V1857_06020 [archaeon]